MVFFLIVCYNCRRVTVPGTRGFFPAGRSADQGEYPEARGEARAVREDATEMEKFILKKGQLCWFCVLIALCILGNYAGSLFAVTNKLPVWLDSAGTALAAYLGGPVCGALVGATTNFVNYLAFGDNWIYCVVSIAIGLVIGLAARRQGFANLLGILTTAMMTAVAATVVATPLNFIFGTNSTGNLWGDAVAGFLTEKGVPFFLSLPVGQLYVEVLDKLAILIVLYAVIRLNGWCAGLKAKRREKEQQELDKANGHEESEEEKVAEATETDKKAAAGLLAVLLAVSLTVPGMQARARADEVPTADTINYNDYVQTIYSSTNGLPCGEANDIAQTNDGILWIGTYAGLYRYNGREFTWMDSYESVRNVNCLYVDEEGRLWIGTNDNGLSIVINGQVANVVDQSAGLPSNAVRSIVRSSDGYYYIGTTSTMQILSLNYGLQRINTLTEVTYADDSAADGKGNVAAVTDSGMLYLLRGGQIRSSRRLIEDGNDAFKSCAFTPDGKLLAATTGTKIHVFDISKGWFEETDVWTCGDLKSIKDMSYLPTGELFISADNGVGYRTPAGHFERINTNHFNNSIDNMLMDYQGNIWFTSSRLGLLRMAPSDFRDIYATVGLDNRVVNTIVEWNGAFYFGTDKGLDAVDLSGKSRVRNELTEQFTGIRIRCMTVDSNGSLWICTYSSGLVEISPDGEQHLYDAENGGFDNRTRVVRQLSDGTIAAGGDTRLCFIRDHRIEESIRMTSKVLTICELPDGTILAGTDGNGVAVLDGRKVSKMMTRADGLSSEVILRVIPDEKTGGVFLVTSNGLCYMNPDYTIRSLDNFPYYNNYDIWIQGTDNLFVLSSAGIYVVDRAELLSGKKELRYDLLDGRRGLNSSLTANSWTWFNGKTGELYLACDTGAFVLNINKLSGGAKVFRMSVPYAKMDGASHRVDRNSPITVSRGVSRLELNPEIINYTIQEPNVGFWLEGFDSDWTIMPQNSLNSIVYTNLPSGSYTFHLAVFDNNKENILAERTYSVVKEKELYDSPWFVLYMLILPMFTVAWVTWLMVKRREIRMEKELAEANRLVEMGKQTVIAIARTVDAKDPRTGGHSRRVALYSRQIAREFGLGDKDCQDIEWAANMHDIGKIAIPDAILNKDSRLTDEEYAVMKSHTVQGAKILSDFTLLDHVIEGAEFHHERYDGRGYPKGLKGEEIPLYARIIGVADAFDAMTANRVYRKQMDFGYVLGELEKGRGTQFDPVFVDILLKLIRDGTIDLNKLYGVHTEDTEEAKEETKKEEKKEEKPGTQGNSGSPSAQ